MKLVISLAVAMGLTFAISSFATTDVNQIIAQTNLTSFYQGQDGRAQARMKITDKQGRQQIRQFNILRKNVIAGGDQHFLISFSRPSEVKGMSFRVDKHVDGDDDRWLFLPALDLVKRIASADKRTSFVGSHFFYEDISGRNTQLDSYKLIDETDGHFVIEATPNQPNTVEFSRYVMKIDKAMMLPTSVDYFDRNSALYRRIEVLKTQQIDGFSSVLRSKVSDTINGGSTLLQFRNIKYNNQLPQSIFSERSMRTPPNSWFK